MSTQLDALIAQQVSASVTAVLSRTADRIAEELAHEMLREPAVRDRLKAATLAAFEATMGHLQEPDD